MCNQCLESQRLVSRGQADPLISIETQTRTTCNILFERPSRGRGYRQSVHIHHQMLGKVNNGTDSYHLSVVQQPLIVACTTKTWASRSELKKFHYICLAGSCRLTKAQSRDTQRHWAERQLEVRPDRLSESITFKRSASTFMVVTEGGGGKECSQISEWCS